MKRKAGREQEAPFFLGRATIKIKSINTLSYYGLVRVEGVGPSSLPWEGNIIAVIRHSRNFILS